MKKYDPSKIEKKWQRYWEGKKLYQAEDFGHDKKNFLLLVEFPYPSGDLHTGHWFAFSVPDIYGRYLRMNGFNVMYPIGFDAFGLPAENAAIKNNIHPRDWTKKNITKMSKQLRSMGAGFDWSREVSTIDPEYYRWTQWIFIQLYKAGLAYRAETLVNWCPNDKTVLANEQVIDNKCDRCGSVVEQRNLSQWMFKITSFADRLIDDLQDLDWPESTKLAQINWIGRSEGAIVEFPVHSSQFPELETRNQKLETSVKVFTTRPDTLFGATFLVVSPELAKKWMGMGWESSQEVKDYISQSLKKTDLQRQEETKDKTGVSAGFNALNPMTEKEIPIWIADYVLGHYGTGAIMAVPAHDQRDYDFAKKYELPIKEVVLNEEKFIGVANEKEGVLISSGQYDGMTSEEARKKITQVLKEKGLGELHKNYRLHDWVLSRQRYWGVPIPMVNCTDCGYQPVEETELPVKLPPLKDFMPADDGRSPLAKAGKWLKVKCPKCGQPAERETDTMDTFVDSSWYYMRYTDSQNEKEFASQEKMAKWLPVPLYFGGAEHNTMHLLYSRFITKALRSQNLVDFSEPFFGRRNHGFIFGPDGQKMSKSKGNVVDPDEQVAKFGADTMRMYFAFMGPYDQNYAWNFDSVLGVRRFLDRVWNLLQPVSSIKYQVLSEDNTKEVDIFLHKSVKKIGEDIKAHKFNTGVSELMKLVNKFEDFRNKGYLIPNTKYVILLKLLAPYAPHIAEELWMEVLGNKTSIHLEKWPEINEELLMEESVTLVIQVNSRVRDTMSIKRGLSEDEVKKIVLANEKVQKEIAGKEIKKFVYIQDKLTNIVV